MGKGLREYIISHGFKTTSQLLFSGGIFLLNLAILSDASISNYGIYALQIAFMYFLSGIVTSRWITPKVLHDKSVEADERLAHYKSICGRIVSSKSLSIHAALALPLPIIFHFWSDSATSSLILDYALVAMGSFALTARELFAKYAYISHSPAELFKFHLIAVLFGAIGYVLLNKVLNVDPRLAGLILYAGVLLPVTIIFLGGAKLLGGHNPAEMTKDVLSDDERAISRSAVLTHVVSNLRSQGYVYMVPMILGAEALGRINSTRLAISAAIALIPVYAQTATARVVRQKALGEPTKVSLREVVFAQTTTILAAVGTALLIQVATPKLHLQIPSYFSYVAAWTLFCSLSAQRAVLESEIQLRYPSTQWRANFLIAIGTLVGIFVLTKTFGDFGVVLALIVSEITMIAWYQSKLRH